MYGASIPHIQLVATPSMFRCLAVSLVRLGELTCQFAGQRAPSAVRPTLSAIHLVVLTRIELHAPIVESHAFIALIH